MEILECILMGISLAMDAFAICICQGLIFKGNKIGLALKFGIVFGLFQILMPILGFYVGNIFNDKISTYGNIVAFIILVALGINMIRDNEEKKCNLVTGVKELLILGIATSIDALAIGLSFAIQGEKNILFSAIIIGLVTFIVSFLGSTLGKKIGDLLGSKAHYLGGGILILLGIKALISSCI